MTPTHAVKKGKRYRYYVSTALITGSRTEHPKGWRAPAGDIEGLELDRLRAFFASRAEISDAIAPLGLNAAAQRAMLDRSAKLAERDRSAIVSSVMREALPKPTDYVPPLVLSITASLRRAGKGVRLIIGNGSANAIDDGLDRPGDCNAQHTPCGP
jgi:site-specific DNA recombinase